MRDEANRRHKAETEMAAMRRQIKNMSTMAEEKSKREEMADRSRRERSRERKQSPGKRREEDRKRSPLFTRKRSMSPKQGERKRSRSRDGGRRKSRDRDDDRRKSRSHEKKKRSRSKSNQKKEDCPYWLQGRCLYGRECKKGVHDPKKEGQNQRPRQDFPQEMVGAPWGPRRGEVTEHMVMVPASQVYGQQGLQGGQLFRQQGQVYGPNGHVTGQGLASRGFGSR